MGFISVYDTLERYNLKNKKKKKKWCSG